MPIEPSTLLQLSPVLIVIGILYLAYLRYMNTLELRVRGISWLQALSHLISSIQRHRGLSTAVLAGDRLFKKPLEETRDHVSRDIERIAELGQWITEHNEWQGITQHWARLAGNMDTLSLSSCFDQHSRLIKNILIFIDDLCLDHELNMIFNQNIDSWREMLTLSEYIGQARALGTWMSIEQNRTGGLPTEKVDKKLTDLNSRILEVLETPNCKKVLDGDTLQRILDYLIFIDKNVLMGSPPISSQAFFEKSTNTLNALFEIMDDKLFQVHSYLKANRSDEYR